MNIDRLLTKAAAERDAGRSWRTREILSSAIPNAGYEPRLFLALGKVLLELGDQLEAGKYLMLSGVRRPEFAEAIALFVKRFGGSQPRRLYAAFPRSARMARLSDYPQPVNDELRSLGLPESFHSDKPSFALPPGASNRPYSIVRAAAALMCFLIFFVLMVHGCAKWIEQWLGPR